VKRAPGRNRDLSLFRQDSNAGAMFRQ